MTFPALLELVLTSRVPTDVIAFLACAGLLQGVRWLRSGSVASICKVGVSMSPKG
jgi:hypothetical protein